MSDVEDDLPAGERRQRAAAGLIGKKLFAVIWRVIDDQEAPEPEHRNISLLKLAVPLLIEDSLIRGLVDHGSRHVATASPARGLKTRSPRVSETSAKPSSKQGPPIEQRYAQRPYETGAR